MNPTVKRFRELVPDITLSDQDLTEILYDQTRDDPIFDDDKKFINDALDIKHARGAARPGNELTRSFQFGVGDMASRVASTAALVGNLAGSESVDNAGLEAARAIREKIRPLAPTIGSISEVRNIPEFGRWAAGLVGSQGPQLATTTGLALIPGVGIPLAAASGFAQNQNYLDMVDQGAPKSTAAKTALGVGAVSGLLETALPFKLANPVLKTAPAAAAKTYIQKVIAKLPGPVAESVVNATEEGGTEMLQELVAIAGEMYANRKNDKYEINEKEILDRLLNSGAGGSVLGAATGPIGYARNRYSERQAGTQGNGDAAVPPPVPPPVPPAQPENVVGQVQQIPGAPIDVNATVQPVPPTPPSDASALQPDESGEEVPAGNTGTAEPSNDISNDEIDFLAEVAAKSLSGELSPEQEASIVTNTHPLAAGIYQDIKSKVQQSSQPTPTTPIEGGEIQNGSQEEVPKNSPDAPEGQGKQEVLTAPEPVAPEAKGEVAAAPPVIDQGQPPQPATTAQPADTRHPMAFEDPKGVLEAEDTKRGNSRKKDKEQKTRLTPIAFNVTDEFPNNTEYSEELADGLASGASETSGDTKSDTRRVTFFENQQTGQIVGVGTFKRGNVVKVGPIPGVPLAKNAKSIPLKNLMSIEYEGAKMWVPIYSQLREKPFSATDPGSVINFQDAMDLESNLSGPFLAKLNSQKQSKSEAFENKATQYDTKSQKEIVATVNPVEETVDDSGSEIDSAAGEVFDSMLEFLPRKDGKISRDLDIQDVIGALKNAAEDFPSIFRSLVVSASPFLKSDPSLQNIKTLSNEEQQLIFLRSAVQRIIAAAKTGAFDPDGGGVTGTGSIAERLFGSGPANTGPDQGPAPKLRSESEQRVTRPAADSRYRAGLDSLLSSGYDVTAINGAIQQGGAFTGRQVLLSVADIGNPTQENLITLFHEAAHALFSGLSSGVQTRILRAISNLNVTGWTPTIDPRTPDVESVRREEHLAESAARALVEQGFDPGQASSIAGRIWSRVKSAYLRVVMAIQQAIYGKANPQTAQEYFQNRLESFLRGDLPLNMAQFFGLGKPAPAGIFVRHESAQGQSWPPAILDESGVYMFQDVLPDSSSAARYAVKYRAQSMANDPKLPIPTGEAADKIGERNIAVQFGLDTALRKAFSDWTASGHNTNAITYEQFLKAGYVDIKESPEEVIKQVNSELVEQGRAAQTPVPVSSLTEFQQKDVARALYPMLQKIRSAIMEKVREANEALSTTNPRSIDARINEKAKEVQDLINSRNNAIANVNGIQAAMSGILASFERDIRSASSIATRMGTLSQVIKDIEGDMADGGAIRTFRNAIDSIWAKFNNGPRLYKLLAKVATTSDFDFKNDPPRVINRKLRILASSDGDLQQMQGDSDEAKALRALVTAFAIKNADFMAAMEMERSTAILIKNRLKDLLRNYANAAGDKADQIEDEINKLKPEFKHIGALVYRIKRAKREKTSLENEAVFHRAIRNFEEDSRMTFVNQAAELEQTLGATLKLWEATHGAEYFVPPKSDTPIDQIFVRTNKATGVVGNNKHVVLNEDGIPVAEIREDRQKIKDWLDNNTATEGSATNRHLREVLQKLEMVEAASVHENIRVSVTNRMIGSITKVLDYIGNPSAKAASAQLRRLSFQRETWLPQARAKGVKWDGSEHRLMRLISPKSWSVEQFRKTWYHEAARFIASHDELLRGQHPMASKLPLSARVSLTPDQAEDEALKLLKVHFQASPDTAAVVNDAKKWDALVAHYKLTSHVNQWMNNARRELGIKVADDSKFKFFRETVGHGLFHIPRGPSGFLRDVYDHMKAVWQVTEPLEMKKLKELLNTAGVAGLQAGLANHFTPYVWENFVGPMANRSGKSLFASPRSVNGVSVLADPNNVKAAFNSTTNPVDFAIELHKLESPGTMANVNEFIIETLSTFVNQFNSVKSVMNDKASTQEPDDSVHVQSFMMDARDFDDWPHEWLTYRAFDQHSMHRGMESFIYENAFGRDLKSIWGNLNETEAELRRLSSRRQAIIEGIVAANPKITKSKLESEFKKAAGPQYIQLISADKNLNSLHREVVFLKSMIGSSSHMPQELRNFFELVSAATLGTVQSIGSAFTDTIAIPEQALRKLGLGTVAGQNIKHSTKAIAIRAAGSFAQIFGRQLKTQSEYGLRLMEVGQVDTDASTKLKDKLISALRAPVVPTLDIPIASHLESFFVKAARGAKVAMQTGVGSEAGPGEVQYPTAKFAVYSWLGQVVNEGAIIGWWQTYEDMVLRGIKHFDSNPIAAADSSFRFKAEDMGYGWNKDAFEFLRFQMESFGINLEDAVRRAAVNKRVGMPLFSKEEYRALSAIVRNEITGDANITNRPTASNANSLIHSTLPLLGWSIWKAGDVATSLVRSPNGEMSAKALRKSLLAYTAIVPLGIAYAMIRDDYDKRWLKKKSANVGLDAQQAAWRTIVNMMARMGVFGIAGDAIDGVVNDLPGREMSVDRRVFAVSMMKNFIDAFSALARQDMEASYSTFYRPLMNALGGAGALQTMQLINGVTSMDNAEARTTSQINVHNWLRSAARGSGIEIKQWRGGTPTSTPTRPWVGRMMLASYAGDQKGFVEAYRGAIIAASKMKLPDPEKAVLQSFSAKHPLRSVTARAMTVEEVQLLLSRMPVNGRTDVLKAVSNFNTFLEAIGGDAYIGSTRTRD